MSDASNPTGGASRILVVDDEASIRHVLTQYLSQQGYDVHAAESAEAALELLAQIPAPEAALVDIVLPGKSGLDLLTTMRRRYPETQVVLITSHGSVDTAIGAIRRGAYDYLQKPFQSLGHVAATVQRALEKRRLSTGLGAGGPGADHLS